MGVVRVVEQCFPRANNVFYFMYNIIMLRAHYCKYGSRIVYDNFRFYRSPTYLLRYYKYIILFRYYAFIIILSLVCHDL